MVCDPRKPDGHFPNQRYSIIEFSLHIVHSKQLNNVRALGQAIPDGTKNCCCRNKDKCMWKVLPDNDDPRYTHVRHLSTENYWYFCYSSTNIMFWVLGGPFLMNTHNYVFTENNITKTCLYNTDPLKLHFYIVKMGFTGVYIIFLISVQKHRFLEVKFSIYLNMCFRNENNTCIGHSSYLEPIKMLPYNLSRKERKRTLWYARPVMIQIIRTTS